MTDYTAGFDTAAFTATDRSSSDPHFALGLAGTITPADAQQINSFGFNTGIGAAYFGSLQVGALRTDTLALVGSAVVASTAEGRFSTAVAIPLPAIGVEYCVVWRTLDAVVSIGINTIGTDQGWRSDVVTGANPLANPFVISGANIGSDFSVFFTTTPISTTTLIGGLVARQRPIGRGPQMNRLPAAFRRSQGSQSTRQLLLQLFSSPGVPLASTSVTFFTAYDDASAAIDGPIVRTTGTAGYVLLVGLNIAAGAGNIRYQITGDPTKHRVSAVNFVI